MQLLVLFASDLYFSSNFPFLLSFCSSFSIVFKTSLRLFKIFVFWCKNLLWFSVYIVWSHLIILLYNKYHRCFLAKNLNIFVFLCKVLISLLAEITLLTDHLDNVEAYFYVCFSWNILDISSYQFCEMIVNPKAWLLDGFIGNLKYLSSPSIFRLEYQIIVFLEWRKYWNLCSIFLASIYDFSQDFLD